MTRRDVRALRGWKQRPPQSSESPQAVSSSSVLPGPSSQAISSIRDSIGQASGHRVQISNPTPGPPGPGPPPCRLASRTDPQSRNRSRPGNPNRYDTERIGDCNRFCPQVVHSTPSQTRYRAQAHRVTPCGPEAIPSHDPTPAMHCLRWHNRRSSATPHTVPQQTNTAAHALGTRNQPVSACSTARCRHNWRANVEGRWVQGVCQWVRPGASSESQSLEFACLLCSKRSAESAL
jgi:hypothetical protein